MYLGSKLEWIILAVVCVFALFLFPAPAQHGPFSAVYGPTTDLRSSIDVSQAIPFMTALVLARVPAALMPAHPELVHRDFAITHSSGLPQHASVLRC